MPAKSTLNAKNLETLGAARLARLLLEVTKGDAAAKRRLRLELASVDGPGALAGEIRKRLAAIDKGRSYIDWQKRPGFIRDLNAQLDAIMQLARVDPQTAHELLWRFLDLAGTVFERTSDGSGQVREVFEAAMEQLGPFADAARPKPEALAERVYQALRENHFGQYDGIVEQLAGRLGAPGLTRLSERLDAWAEEPPEPFPQHREIAICLARQAIALARGDLDGFIVQYGDQARRAPAIAADIARRLLTAGRVDEAWAAIEAAAPADLPAAADLDDLATLLDFAAASPSAANLGWEEARLAVLEAMGRNDEAQAFRLACFAARLEPGHLRAYLQRLADFDDIEAERRALQHVQAYPEVHRALAFLVTWPALPAAEALVRARADELDGDQYELLAPAAEALAARHPLAATLCLRAMIDFTLSRARSSRYGHAARHLATGASLAAEITDWGTIEPHGTYAARLRKVHGRKHGFWSQAR